MNPQIRERKNKARLAEIAHYRLLLSLLAEQLDILQKSQKLSARSSLALDQDRRALTVQLMRAILALDENMEDCYFYITGPHMVRLGPHIRYHWRPAS